MRIFLTGATGLIGRRLVSDRLSRGDQVIALSRSAARAAAILPEHSPSLTLLEGDPTIPGDWEIAMQGCDVVIHLAGAGVMDHRWTKSYKKVLFSSRIDSTRCIVNALRAMAEPDRPKNFICASAIGYYGDCGDRELTENAPPGDDFLAVLTAAWERESIAAEALAPIRSSPMRVVRLRTGIVLDDQGGALPKMKKIFRLGLGGPMGNGKQWMSWIHWHDLIELIHSAVTDSRLTGAVNAVSLNPVRNKEFAKILGQSLRRPAVIRLPRLLLRLGLGQAAEALTASQRVIPAKARSIGLEFQYPHLAAALASHSLNDR